MKFRAIFFNHHCRIIQDLGVYSYLKQSKALHLSTEFSKKEMYTLIRNKCTLLSLI